MPVLPSRVFKPLVARMPEQWLSRVAPSGDTNRATLERMVTKTISQLDRLHNLNASDVLTITFCDDGGRVSRNVVVVTDKRGKRRAFYRSSGMCGGSKLGDWIPFHGIVARDRTPLISMTWFVKQGNAKIPDPGEFPNEYEIHRLLNWADRQGKLTPVREIVVNAYGDEGTLAQLQRAFAQISELNQWLKEQDALSFRWWRRPIPDQPIGTYNDPFPLIGVDMLWPGEMLRQWSERAGISQAEVARMPAREVMERSDVVIRRRNPETGCAFC
jgi:hypothetical protein